MSTRVRDDVSDDARPRHVVRWAAVLLAFALLAAIGGAWLLSPRPVHPKGLVMGRLHVAGGSYVPLDSIALLMREAVVVAEDERFWRHHGVDAIGLARAAAYDVSHFSLRQGASTITEQLGKDLYLGGDDHSPLRKAEDAVIAVRLESHLSKDQILELYLNEVYFGAGAVGVDQASERYFGSTPSHLSLGEASLLAGLIEAPTPDDPFTDAPAARDRQAQVLTSMVRDGFVTESEAQQAVARPLPLADGKVLPADRDATVQPGPQVSLSVMLTGFALVTIGAVGFVLARRKRLSVWPPVSIVACGAGLVLVARAFRVD